jgi:hypothetical protein
MFHSNRGFATAIAAALAGLFVTTAPAMSADLGPQPSAPLAEPKPYGASPQMRTILGSTQLGACPLWVISGHVGLHERASASPLKADIL